MIETEKPERRKSSVRFTPEAVHDDAHEIDGDGMDNISYVAPPSKKRTLSIYSTMSRISNFSNFTRNRKYIWIFLFTILFVLLIFIVVLLIDASMF